MSTTSASVRVATATSHFTTSRQTQMGTAVLTLVASSQGLGPRGPISPTGDSDCWGCHGFAVSSAPGLGPIVPFIDRADVLVIPGGADTAITLNGSSFTNTLGAFEWRSSVALTAKDGSSILLEPDTMDACSLTVTIPGTTAAGNYEVRAMSTASNPVVISVTPPAVISSVDCNEQSGTVTITGSGFSERPAGTEAYINVTENGIPLNIYIIRTIMKYRPPVPPVVE